MDEKTKQHIRAYWLIGFAAILLNSVIGIFVYRIMEIRYQRQPIWVEQVAYLHYPSVRFHATIKKEGFISAAKGAIISHDRSFLQLLILGAIHPDLLSWWHTHLLITMPLFAIFLFVFCITVYKHTGNLFYAIATMVFYVGISELTSSKWGIGTGFSDYQSMLLISIGVLFLIEAIEKPRLSQIFWFALFTNLSVFARTTTLFIATVMCAPLFLFYLVRVYRQHRSWGRIGTSIGLAIVMSIPAAGMLWVQFSNLLRYYTGGTAWNLHFSFTTSLTSIISLFTQYLGWLIILASVGMLVGTFDWKKVTRLLRDPFFVSVLWWLGGFPAFLLINGYVSDVPKEVMYVVPPFILTVTNLFLPQSKKAMRIFCLFMVFSGLVSFVWFTASHWQDTLRVSNPDRTFRESQEEMAQALTGLPADTIWQSYALPDWGIPVSLLTQYQFTSFRKTYNVLFHNSKSYWDALYPGLTIDQVQEKVYEKTLFCVDAAVVLKEPLTKPAKYIEMEDYSYRIASYISHRVKADAQWHHYKDISGEPFIEVLSIYVKEPYLHTSDC